MLDAICKGCRKKAEQGIVSGQVIYHYWARRDAYGMFTGIYCNKCYDDPEKYTYRKDRYHDPMYAGERLEPDDNLPWEY